MNDIYNNASPSDELKSEREFYRARGEVCPKDLPQANEEELQQDDKAINDTDYHRLDEQVRSPGCYNPFFAVDRCRH